VRIGCDIDGVLADFTSAFNALVRVEFDIKLPNPAPTWNWHREGGVTREQESKLWDYIKNSMWWGTLHALPGALDAIEKLNLRSKGGHDIYFITSRPGKLSKYLTEVWLKYHGMDTPTVLVTSDKGPVAKGLRLDVFVDDKPENITDVLIHSPSTRSYLVDHLYNRGWDFTDTKVHTPDGQVITVQVARVESLNSVLDIELAEERKAA